MTKDTTLIKSDGLDISQPLTATNLSTGLTPTEKKNIEYLVEKHQFTENQALEHELTNMDLISTLQRVAKEKAEAGFGESAQKLITGIAILMDKTYGDFTKQSGPMFNVAGKQVSIKVGFGFKPYQKK